MGNPAQSCCKFLEQKQVMQEAPGSTNPTLLLDLKEIDRGGMVEQDTPREPWGLRDSIREVCPFTWQGSNR